MMPKDHYEVYDWIAAVYEAVEMGEQFDDIAPIDALVAFVRAGESLGEIPTFALLDELAASRCYLRNC